jgi:hypothetical protein
VGDPRGPRGREAIWTAIGVASGCNTDNRLPFHVVAFIKRVEARTLVPADKACLILGGPALYY